MVLPSKTKKIKKVDKRVCNREFETMLRTLNFEYGKSVTQLIKSEARMDRESTRLERARAKRREPSAYVR